MLSFYNYLKRLGFPISIFLVIFLLDPYQKAHFAGYALTILIYVKKEFLLKNLDLDYVILFLFSIVYALFSLLDPDIFFQTTLFFGLFPPVFYLIGKFFVTKTNNYNDLFHLLIIIGVLYSFSALVSVLLNLKQGGFVQYGRDIPMFWNGKLWSATIMGAFFTFNMCIPGLLLARQIKLNIFYKIFLILTFIASLLCVFRLGSRTQLAVSLITFIGIMIFILLKQSFSKNLRLFFILILLAIFIFTYIPLDLDSEYLSTLGRRLQESDNTGSAGGRTERWIKSIHNLFIKPFGWDFKEFGYSHNLWLDIAQANGIIPFFILIIFSIRSLLNTKKAILSNKNALSFNSLMLAFTIGANLLFFVEPVTEGVFSIFLVFCLFQGVINNYLIMQKNTIH